MAIREIVTWPNEVLTTPCRTVEEFGTDLRKVADDMVETMYAAPGVGLAANQIGVDLRLLVIDCGDPSAPEEGDAQTTHGTETRQPSPTLICAVNPEIVFREGEQPSHEGCLSFPEIEVDITRPARIRVRYQDLGGAWAEAEANGLWARCWCHEIDHISGVTFLEHISSLKREMLKRQIRKLIKSGEWGPVR